MATRGLARWRADLEAAVDLAPCSDDEREWLRDWLAQETPADAGRSAEAEVALMLAMRRGDYV